jgi:hypothetical protein
MKFPFYRHFHVLRFCAIYCLTAALTPVCAQSQPAPVLLELKACAGELQVFEDGTVISKYGNGTMTERRLSQSRMRKVRQIIARGPCQKEIRTATATADTSYCMEAWRGYLTPGWQEVVIRHYPDRQSVAFPVYIPCDSKKGNNPSNNPVWQRFLSKVVGAIGGKSILKGCKCR